MGLPQTSQFAVEPGIPATSPILPGHQSLAALFLLRVAWLIYRETVIQAVSTCPLQVSLAASARTMSGVPRNRIVTAALAVMMADQCTALDGVQSD